MPSTAAPLHVLIVGAGITGLTAAIAYRQKGFSVTALEASIEFSHAKDVGVVIKMGYSVREYDAVAPKAIANDGTVFEADVILAADDHLQERASSVDLTNLVPAEMPLIGLSFLSKNYTECLNSRNSSTGKLRQTLSGKLSLLLGLTFEILMGLSRIGQGKHVVAYLLRQGTVYNVVLTGPAQKTIGSKYVVKADVTEVLEQYKDWDPCLVKVLKELPDDSTLEWRLCDMEPMDSWVFPGGKISLMGDACHAVLPSAAQGAGMGMEDGVAVAEFLARTESISQIPQALKAYQELRPPRCEAIMTGARGDAKKWQGRSGAPPKAGVSSEWSWEYDVKRAARESPLEG
ncbi:hypothetical protein AUP68_15157 [Ilyonectria robusta]